MHRTTSTASRSATRRFVFLGLLAAMLLLALAQAVPAFAASSPFDGGPLAADTSTTMANDHTVYAMRFAAASGGLNPLDADTTYYVKVRFTPNADGSPAGIDNRGFTWNGTSGDWAQERDDWTAFPTVTTDANGAIAQSVWIYYKFGDTTKTGPYYLLVSLSIGIAGNTRNGTWSFPRRSSTWRRRERGCIQASTTPPTPARRARWSTHAQDQLRPSAHREEPATTTAMASSTTSSTAPCRTVVSTWPCPAAPGPGDRIEVHGLAGAGRLHAHRSRHRHRPRRDDQTAPSAPGTLSGDPMVSGVDLSWGSASDDIGVTGYDVYRWTDAGAGAGYTPPPVRIANGTTGTTYIDTDVSAGANYRYLVRAVDAATNVGPRSTAADVTPKAVPQLTLSVLGHRELGRPAPLRGVLTDVPTRSRSGRQVSLSRTDGTTWTVADARPRRLLRLRRYGQAHAEDFVSPLVRR